MNEFKCMKHVIAHGTIARVQVTNVRSSDDASTVAATLLPILYAILQKFVSDLLGMQTQATPIGLG